MGGPPLFLVTINTSVKRGHAQRCRQASVSSAFIGEWVAFAVQAKSIRKLGWRQCSLAACPAQSSCGWLPRKGKEVSYLLEKAPGCWGSHTALPQVLCSHFCVSCQVFLIDRLPLCPLANPLLPLFQRLGLLRYVFGGLPGWHRHVVIQPPPFMTLSSALTLPFLQRGAISPLISLTAPGPG